MEMPRRDQGCERCHPLCGQEDSELDEIMYRISHDLGASVRALQELPCWIEEDLTEAAIRLPGNSRRHLQLLSSHAARLDAMLSGLLEFSRVGRMQTVDRLDPAEVFSEVLEDLSVGSQVVIQQNFCGQPVCMGETDLKRIFAILLSNAIKFHPDHAPEIIVTSHGNNLPNWHLEISDDGPGIAENLRHLVFLPMSKLASRDQEDGAGMGLAILKKILRTYGGSVRIDTAPSGRGTIFRLTIPVISSQRPHHA